MFKPSLWTTIERELTKLNPWVHNTDYESNLTQIARAIHNDVGPISEKVHYEQALASRLRWQSGIASWNRWADEMLRLRSEAEEDPVLVAICDALARANFCGSSFDDTADFASMVFPAEADFSGTEFWSPCWFQASTFGGVAHFTNARFMQPSSFCDVEFRQACDFSFSTWHEQVEFRNALFADAANFTNCCFMKPAWFAGAGFTRVDFEAVQFEADAGFMGCTFAGDVGFSGATFAASCSFERAQFNRRTCFGGVRILGPAWFKNSEFAEAPDSTGISFSNRSDFPMPASVGAGNLPAHQPHGETCS